MKLYTVAICVLLVAKCLGNCPPILDDSVGTCSEDCSSDTDCMGEQKCCSNGCGHVCEDPLWYCPPTLAGSVGICSEECASDGDCSGNQRCCGNGCGHECMDPVKNKPPSGPCPVVDNEAMGICLEECSSDEDCKNATQICCSNGCGHICMDTGIRIPHGCRLGENFYNDGESVPTTEDCKTCHCTNGDVVCKINVNCREQGIFSMAMVTPILCSVAGLLLSLLLVLVIVNCYILRAVPKRKSYKLMHERKKKRKPPKVRHDSHEMVVNVDNQPLEEPKTLKVTTAVKYPDVSIIQKEQSYF